MRNFVVNNRNLNYFVRKKMLFLKRKNLKSKFLLCVHMSMNDFKAFLRHIRFKFKSTRKAIYFNNKKLDKKLNKFWRLYWYNLSIYLKLNFAFTHLCKKSSFINGRKQILLAFFFHKEYVFFKWSLVFRHLGNSNISLKKKLKLYKYRLKNYYNFFNFPIKAIIDKILFLDSILKNKKDLNDFYFNQVVLKKKEMLTTLNALYALFWFLKNRELFEMESLFFKQMNFKYKFLGSKRFVKWASLDRKSILFIKLLIKRYTKFLLIPLNFSHFPRKLEKMIRMKSKKSKKIVKKKVSKTKAKKSFSLYSNKKKGISFDTKRKAILKQLILRDVNFNIKDRNLLLFFKKSFSNIFITLTDLNLKVIVCKTSTIAGIKGNKRRKVAPQAIEYIIASLLKYRIKNVYICLNLKSNIKKFLYTLLRELSANNVNVKGLLRFCIRAHNGVRGRTSLKKI